MKKRVQSLFVAAFFICCGFTQVIAQQQMPPIPVDPNVRVGKLDNGLTYYIRKNSLPENRVDFYIAQKVGSIQETPEQKGLAHFLEHMCFNGTTHFPGDNLKQYLESIGVKFGINLNAYTSIDETVYNITNVPATREGAIDSCLLILHDWANDLILDPKEIDKERGVIHEEWRTRMSAMQRLQEKARNDEARQEDLFTYIQEINFGFVRFGIWGSSNYVLYVPTAQVNKLRHFYRLAWDTF